MFVCYSAVIVAEPLREFTRFNFDEIYNGDKRLPTQDQARWLKTVSPPVQAAKVYAHHCHLLLLLCPKANTHLTVPQRVEGWVDLIGWLHT